MPGVPAALFAFAAIAAVPTSSTAAGDTQDAINVEVVEGRADAADRMTVPVQIGTGRPYSSFLVDTGSQKTVLSTEGGGAARTAAGREAGGFHRRCRNPACR